MATLTKGTTYTNGSTVTPTNLNAHVDSATVTFTSAGDTDNSTLEVSGNKFQVKNAGITAAKVAPGFPVQVKSATNVTFASSTTTRTINDTAPSVTDGVQIGTLAITPASTSNTVLVRASGHIVANGANNLTVMVFRGSTCISAGYVYCATQNDAAAYCLEVMDSPNSNSSVTYTVRAAGNTAAGFYVNGNWNGTAGARTFGGVQGQTLTLTEIAG